MIYLLDTNIVSDLMGAHVQVRRRAAAAINDSHQLAICRPVYYEVLRGLLWRKATAQTRDFRHDILPLFVWVELVDADWEQAAEFWADARGKGRQLGDPDLLLAAIVHRLSAILVSDDGDFEALPIQRENWRV